MKVSNFNKKLNAVIENDDSANPPSWFIPHNLSDPLSRKIKPLDEMHTRQVAQILQYKLSPEKDFIPTEFREYYDFLSNHFSDEELWSALPTNNEYYFLSSIRRERPQNESELLSLASDYELDEEQLFKLRSEDKIDWLDSIDLEIVERYKKDGLISEEKFQEFEDRGFITRPTDEEAKFLKEISGKEFCIDTEDFKEICARYGIEEKRLMQLSSKNSHISILSTNQKKWLSSGANLHELGEFNLSEKDFHYEIMDWYAKFNS